MSSTETIAVGDTVRFAEVIDDGDAEARMIVLEIEADRDWALVEDTFGVENMALKPTRAVRLSEVVKA